MLYTERDQLSIIEIESGEESISMEKLEKVLLKYPSNVLYCELNGKLVGIISIGDIYRAYEKGLDKVYINKKFTYLYAGEDMKARTIFLEKKMINALPVVTEDNILIGDYTRWDDLAMMEYILNTMRQGLFGLDGKQHIVLVKPDRRFGKRLNIFRKWKAYLQSQDIEVRCVGHSEVFGCMENMDMILFVDENEIRTCKLLLTIMFGMSADVRRMKQLRTYNNVIKYHYNNEKCVSYLEKLRDKGINILALSCDENEDSIYYKRLTEEIRNRFAAVGELPSWRLSKLMYKDFFDNLYSEEYVEEIMKTNTFGITCNGGILRLKDRHGKFYNFINGERYTVGQPKNFTRSIYFYGACYIVGRYSDDERTIESVLQKHLSCDETKVRVVNCGCFGSDFSNTVARIAVTPLKKGDIVIMDRRPLHDINWMNYIDLNKVLEENKVSAAWLVDNAVHCNHRVYELYANAIYESLKPILSVEADESGELIEKDENYIRFLYLDQYFSSFDHTKYDKIGAIVMNCNPFTYGHRYLIDQALKTVDYLIIFVVEEDKSIFSYTERFIMVCEGVADLKNVKVVPSGQFILSQKSFPEYFIKETSEDIVEHTEQDITTFAEKIAPQLGIKYRFVGEEPEDTVTNQYNLAMKKILPKYDIELIEIPRWEINGQYISASSARRYMEENNRDMLNKLLPETTRKIIYENREGWLGYAAIL